MDNPDEQLRPEMNARVNFLAESRSAETQSVTQVLVPKAAVVRRDGALLCFVVKGTEWNGDRGAAG